MIKIIKKFFAFCNIENRKKFFISIWFNVFKSFFIALKIPAIAVIIHALLRGNIENHDILLSLGIMLISVFFEGLFTAKSTMLQTEAGYDTCAKKRIYIAEHMRYLPMGYFNDNSIGKITSVTTNVMENLENVATRVIMLVCEGLLTTALIILMLFFFDYRIALILLFGFILFLLANSKLQKAASTLADKKINYDEKLVEKVLEYIQGMAEVKSYHLTGSKCKEVNEAILANKMINIEMELKLIPFMSLQSLIAKLTGVFMIAFSCIFYCFHSMDALIAIVMVISAFIIYSSLESAGQYSALLRVVDLSVDRVQDILNIPKMDISGADIKPTKYDFDVKNISFSYAKKKIIDDISIYIPEKTKVAIVGPSGSGKTTLINLLARFWDVDNGEIIFGGHNVKEYDMDSLMNNFSFVFQSVYLFHDTIANNIRFERPDTPMKDVISAAKKACCHDFISSLPNGYDTIIGEGGANLSGGEKQRISIARAILKDSPIIFLDEATANVDPENENDLIHAIQKLTEEKTVIMIAHRLKTVQNADQILVINKGKIVQKGRHDELMNQNGIYRKLINNRNKAINWELSK